MSVHPHRHAPIFGATGWPTALASYAALAAGLLLVTILSGTRLQLAMLPWAGVTRHVVGFAVITVLFWRVFTVAAGPRCRRWADGLAVLAASFFGAVDEIHHLFVRGRDGDLGDWLVDTLSAAVTVAVLSAGRRLWAKREPLRRPLPPRQSDPPAAEWASCLHHRPACARRR